MRRGAERSLGKRSARSGAFNQWIVRCKVMRSRPRQRELDGAHCPARLSRNRGGRDVQTESFGTEETGRTLEANPTRRADVTHRDAPLGYGRNRRATVCGVLQSSRQAISRRENFRDRMLGGETVVGADGWYATACQSPLEPRSKSLDIGRGGQPADPDSDIGQKEARRHEKASAAYAEGKYVLKNAGRLTEQAVEATVLRDCYPAGVAELAALRDGLSALWALWSSRKR